MSLKSIDVITSDVLSAAKYFTEVVGLQPTELSERFAEIPAGDITILLSPDAMVPMSNAAGTILHFEVEDVHAAERRARDFGAEILQATMTTDWGWESCLVRGPEQTVVDLFKPADQ